MTFPADAAWNMFGDGGFGDDEISEFNKISSYMLCIVERFAYLSNTAAVPMYLVCTVLTIAISACAGPAAVAAGAHIAHVAPSTRSLYIGLLLATIREFGIQVLRLALKISRPQSNETVSDRRMIVDKHAFLLPGPGSRTWVALTLVFGGLIAIVLIYLLAAMGFAVGIAALGAHLAIGHVPTALLVATLPAISYLALFQLLRLSMIGDIPIGIPNHAIAGVIYAHMCERQGYWICSKGTAAGAGAVFATIANSVEAPIEILYYFVRFSFTLTSDVIRGLFSKSHVESFDSIFQLPSGAKKSRLGSMLFGSPDTIEHLLFGPGYKVTKDEIEAAIKAERDELGQHPELQKVYLSRPSGLDKKTHYVLIVGERKYELRLHGAREAADRNGGAGAKNAAAKIPNENKGAEANAKDAAKASNEPFLRYNTDLVYIDACDPKDRLHRDNGIHARRLWSPTTQTYAPKPYDVLLIGWTTATAEEIDYICTKTIKNWVYRLFINTSASGNCQNFVRIVADQICRQSPLAPYTPPGLYDDSEKDPDSRYHASNWNWFRHDVYGPLQQIEYNKRRGNFWEESFVPMSIIRLRSPLEAGSEITRFVANFQRWTSCDRFDMD